MSTAHRLAYKLPPGNIPRGARVQAALEQGHRLRGRTLVAPTARSTMWVHIAGLKPIRLGGRPQ